MKFRRLIIAASAIAIGALAPKAQTAAETDSIALLPDSILIVEQPEPVAVYTDSVPEFQRGLQQIAFIPKGQWIAGVSVSFSQSDQDNYQFLIAENIKGDTYSFKVSPMVMYAFKDNMALGGRFSYTRQRTRLNNANIKIDSETSYDIDNLFAISHSYSGMALYRNYISFGASTRFGMINEVQLELSGGQSKICNGAGDDLTGTYERTFSVDVGVAPGIIMFLSNYSAIEVNVGVLGFSYSKATSTTDQIYKAHRDVSKANFKVNLFSITFGVVFYI